jgi:transcriptional regulator with XRE-family HTH domain
MTKPLHHQLLDESPDAAAEYERLRPRFEFVTAVVQARTKLGWSQRDLARAVGVSQPVIARLESGDHDPKLGTMLAVCRALGLPLTVGQRTVLAKGKPASRTA